MENLFPHPEKQGGPHLVITSGKGGVGKTTVSILVADALARGGWRVLVVSLDQAKHLQEYLGLGETNRAYRVDGGLWALQFDLEREAERFTQEYVMLLQQIMPGLKALNLEKYAEVVRNSPGFEEEIYLRYLEGLYSRREYDYIVVDTPPTGITLRILGLPGNYVFWLERLSELRERIVGARYVISKALGERPEVRDPVLDKLGELRQRYGGLRERLSSSRDTSYVVVATPEPLPVFEARKTLEQLRRLGATVRLLAANKVLPPDKARLLGVHGVQRKSLEELAQLPCPGECRRIAIMATEEPPHSLTGARRLLERVAPLQEVLSA